MAIKFKFIIHNKLIKEMEVNELIIYSGLIINY